MSNIYIFGELLSNNIDVFRVFVKPLTFSECVTTNTADYLQITCTNLLDLGLFYSTRIVAPSAFLRVFWAQVRSETVKNGHGIKISTKA